MNVRSAKRLAWLSLVLAAVTYRSWFPDVKWLRIRTVEVVADAPLTEREVRHALPLLVGKNLLLLDGEAVLERLMMAPWIAGASLKKEYPDRLVVSVQAKRPIALCQDGLKLSFLDEKGATIDRYSADRARGADLPLIVFEKAEQSEQWTTKSLVEILTAFQKKLGEKHAVSQIVALDPPYFKVFLNSPALETLFSVHTWESQLPYFQELLGRPPRQIGQANKINLVSPKKAVVSFPLSH